jgi:hypothetical protein
VGGGGGSAVLAFVFHHGFRQVRLRNIGNKSVEVSIDFLPVGTNCDGLKYINGEILRIEQVQKIRFRGLSGLCGSVLRRVMCLYKC